MKSPCQLPREPWGTPNVATTTDFAVPAQSLFMAMILTAKRSSVKILQSRDIWEHSVYVCIYVYIHICNIIIYNHITFTKKSSDSWLQLMEIHGRSSNVVLQWLTKANFETRARDFRRDILATGTHCLRTTRCPDGMASHKRSAVCVDFTKGLYTTSCLAAFASSFLKSEWPRL